MVPLESRVAVPMVRPDASRNVLVPLLSVVTVPRGYALALFGRHDGSMTGTHEKNALRATELVAS
jgi:hypothetical protein